jgi:hypothetical protein
LLIHFKAECTLLNSRKRSERGEESNDDWTVALKMSATVDMAGEEVIVEWVVVEEVGGGEEDTVNSAIGSPLLYAQK